MLGEGLKENIQIEFVISDDKVYIVQLRILKNEPTHHNSVPDKKQILYKGKSFCTGYHEYSGWKPGDPDPQEFKLEDVLVIDEDADDSSLLLGKKALIVRNDNIEFSHMLALSKALNIPSIYAVGNVQLPEAFRINARGEEGLIMKSRL